MPLSEHTNRNFDWAALEDPISDWPDHKVASWASEFLNKKQEEPFFLAAGMFRPHVPWFQPKEFVDMHDLKTIKRPPYLINDLSDVPEIARKWAEDSYSKHSLVKELGLWEEAIRAYIAGISFSDSQIGRILDALDASSYKDNTIIVLWSDHGYHLGEKEHWHKQTLRERATRVPFIIVAPGNTKPGSVCNRPVSLIDIYPTLIELCNLPERNNLDGTSLVPWLKNPKLEKENPAITTKEFNNHAVRSEKWRYIRYNDGTEELYDHEQDPNEWHNLIGDPKYKNIIDEHRNWLPKINKPNVLNFKPKFKEVIFDPEKYEWSISKNSN
jgi:arylsulfatase A-like enzyme